MNWTQTLTDLETIVCKSQPYPVHRRNKWYEFYILALKSSGPIVEIGTWFGGGTIALCRGTRNTVYTVDSYQDYHDYAGVSYGPANREVALSNFKAANVNPILIEKDEEEACTQFKNNSLGLVVWDIATDALRSFLLWERTLKKDGVFAFHGNREQFNISNLLQFIATDANWCYYGEEEMVQMFRRIS